MLACAERVAPLAAPTTRGAARQAERHTMRIGPYELSSSVVLAPMAGVTDRPFRQIARSFGAGLAASEMITSDVRLWSTKKTQRRMDHVGEPEPREQGIDRRRADHRHQHGLPRKKSLQPAVRFRVAH